MNVFHCDHCDNLVFFENTVCVSCEHRLAFLPDVLDMGSLDPVQDDQWSTAGTRTPQATYRLCQNYTEHQVCNWAIEADDPNPLCRSCRLTRAIPDLEVPGHREAWYRLELAKRRLLYTLERLKLPVQNDGESGPVGLVFEFLADVPGGPAVLTGHAAGVITVNVAEADDAEREKRRTLLGEPYRTLIGHFRHESGHYYWSRLIEGTPLIDRFRELFGSDEEDYAAALDRHYQAGPPADWQQRFVSAYASAHPWEDWAETWAHYLHMTDTLETAAACGLSIRPRRSGEPELARVPAPAPSSTAFDQMVAGWHPVTYVLNNLNRGLGLADAYPFVLAPAAIDKLRFVHDVVVQAAAAETSGSSRTAAAAPRAPEKNGTPVGQPGQPTGDGTKVAAVSNSVPDAAATPAPSQDGTAAHTGAEGAHPALKRVVQQTANAAVNTRTASEETARAATASSGTTNGG